MSDEQALFVGDVLATEFWAARISEIKSDDTVLIIGAGPTGICTLLCVMLKQPKHIIVCEKSPERARFVREHYPSVEVVVPSDCLATVPQKCERGGADVVLEVAGAEDTFRLAWECARPNAIVTVVALYDKPQMLPLPEMYGKNLTFKTGGVDGCDCWRCRFSASTRARRDQEAIHQRGIVASSVAVAMSEPFAARGAIGGGLLRGGTHTADTS